MSFSITTDEVKHVVQHRLYQLDLEIYTTQLILDKIREKNKPRNNIFRIFFKNKSSYNNKNNTVYYERHLKSLQEEYNKLNHVLKDLDDDNVELSEEDLAYYNIQTLIKSLV